MSTGTYNWLEMQIVAVANVEVVDWGQITGGNAATANVSRSKAFAVVGGMANTTDNVRSKVLSPYTSVYTNSMVSIATANTNVVVSASFWDSKTKYMVLEEKSSVPPTKPASFTKQPIGSSVNLSSETIALEWSASTSPSGDTISYSLEMFNDSSWIAVASNIATTTYSYILPKLNTDKAQFWVMAVDSKGGKSEYTLSNMFTIATHLLLIQDNNIVKSFKDGVWKSI